MRDRPKDWTWWGELSGAFGDLGVTLPLASALILSSGYPAPRLFFLWGAIYVLSGLVFKIPISVQPLKAMAAIAIAAGIGASELSTAAVGYGLLLLVLALSGLVDRIRSWFSAALVQGIQLGIGLILLHKSWVLVEEGGWILGASERAGGLGIIAALGAVATLQVSRIRLGTNLAVPLFVAGAVAGVLLAGWPDATTTRGDLVRLAWPQWSLWPSLFLTLMLPQLPLTLGNAVIAANDACHHYWPERSGRVSVRNLAASIGLSNLAVGFLGGFPVCHGAGGIAAHARFGGKTGRTAMILGGGLIVAALVPLGSALLLRIPIPLLGALLALVGWELIRLVKTLESRRQWIVAATVGVVSFLFRNLAAGLLAGWVLERVLARQER